MTTTFMGTTAIPLFKVSGETYCRMIDVVKLIHHEMTETEDPALRTILDRMEMRVCKNDFLLPDAQKPVSLQDNAVPGRYAVGYCDTDGNWSFYVRSVNGKAEYSRKPCMAKLFVNCRDASACADFLDEDASVLDWEYCMTEEDRWKRELRMPFPFDADEGMENTIPIQILS